MQKIKLYASKPLFVLFVLLALTLCVFIFCMSSEPAVESSARSASIVVKVVQTLVPDLDRYVPPQKQPDFFSQLNHYLRKVAHFSLYALLGILLFCVSAYWERPWLSHYGTAVAGAALYAVTDEIHQSFAPGRGPRISDVLLDTAGAAFGALILLLFVLWALKRKRAKKPQEKN